MIRKNREEIEWFEFKQLQDFPVRHGVFLDKPIQSAVYFNQVHGKEVVSISSIEQAVTADGGITHVKELPLAIRHADCQAAIFYDPVKHVVANIHAGWRGMVQNIYHETISLFSSQYGSKPENLLVCIGPSLEPEHSEFIHYEREFPPLFCQFQEKPNFFNLWEIARFQLKNSGILFNHIEIAEIGTYSSPYNFPSYRKSKTTSRLTTLASLL
jgi:YfiH family protein